MFCEEKKVYSAGNQTPSFVLSQNIVRHCLYTGISGRCVVSAKLENNIAIWEGTEFLLNDCIAVSFHFSFSFVLSLQTIFPACLLSAKMSPLIEKISDQKDFKKLLRTRNNILVLYSKSCEFLSLISPPPKTTILLLD